MRKLKKIVAIALLVSAAFVALVAMGVFKTTKTSLAYNLKNYESESITPIPVPGGLDDPEEKPDPSNPTPKPQPEPQPPVDSDPDDVTDPKDPGKTELPEEKLEEKPEVTEPKDEKVEEQEDVEKKEEKLPYAGKSDLVRNGILVVVALAIIYFLLPVKKEDN